MSRPIPWWEAVKLALLAGGLYVAWLLYRRLDQTARNVDAATPAIASLSTGTGNLLGSIGDWIGGK